ncbi:putative quinol monooxygenase [Leifsonia sp. TF02-11]|uniref:putative quinol monooxygenase n=1 Tax=Leifsonia sp. TF02-11 TaxID=2815212 RepID=UPI001AA0D06F|nr:antibiotic biosynthesis monooxygenase [Leifsonia sp. TF02-11]MBN9631652.1 antibiotic biosynthesis monooxygenase [Actinomycetota bacterium]MBO1739502.1 antibiotic biosynthesis monooxygenase [Leifsonia sp. TF02-11]
MTVTSLLDLRFAPDHLEDGPRALSEILADTRAFDGCLGVRVVTDVTDSAHVVAVERWESLEHDDAYRAWRAGPGASGLGAYLAEPPTLTRFTDDASL